MTQMEERTATDFAASLDDRLEEHLTGVFVDDWETNVDGAKAVGMEGLVHRSARFTIPKLEELLGVELGAAELSA